MQPESKRQTRKHHKILTRLANIAATTKKYGGQRVASAIVLKHDIIALGTNQEKSHPLQAEWGKNEHAIYLHAEINAIRKALRKIKAEDLQKATLYINRLDKHGGWAVSRPCPYCMNAIKSYKIGKIVIGTPNNCHEAI